jgi:uroporphyrinogen-III synthase
MLLFKRVKESKPRQPRRAWTDPQAADARPLLATGLAAAGAEAVVVVAYDKRLPDAALFAGTPLGWVTFTSPRIVRPGLTKPSPPHHPIWSTA